MNSPVQFRQQPEKPEPTLADGIEEAPSRNARTTASPAADGFKRVWLTFDDGPNPTETPRILRTLAKFKIQATFFLIGQNAAANPGVMEAIHNEGHRIGNHTYTHPNLPLLTAPEMRAEIERTESVLQPFLSREKLFRFPFGDYNAAALQVVKDAGYRAVGWNVDPRDWDLIYQPDGWVARGLDQVKGRESAVILAHDSQPTTAEFLEPFLQQILALGEAQFQSPDSL